MRPTAWFVITALVSANATGASYRFLLGSQYDFSAKRGFYLDLESEAPDGQRCTLAKTKVYFAVADGTQWQFPGYAPAEGWRLNHVYNVVASVAPNGAIDLSVDGQSVATAKGGPVFPQNGALQSNMIPDWGAAPTEFQVHQTSLKIEAGRQVVTVKIPSATEIPPALAMLGRRSTGQESPLVLMKGSRLTVYASFVLQTAQTWKDLAPLVDKYGQSRYGSWPEKVTSDEDLVRAAKEEDAQNQAWGVPPGYDHFGGFKKSPWHEKGTGYFRTVKRDGRWWLISPEGWPTFYTGVSTVPDAEWDFTPIAGREALFEELPQPGPFRKDNAWGGNEDGAYASLQGLNLLRKYGADWKAAVSANLVKRMSAWGFSGLGKWAGETDGLASLPVLGNPVAKLVRHLDPFDPAAQESLRTGLASQITPLLHDRGIVGWSIGNEFDEIITSDEIRQTLKDHATSPAATTLLTNLTKNRYGGDSAQREAAWKSGIPDADLEAMRTDYAQAYYGLLYKTVKSIDSNHLYLGFWIVPGWWQNESDWKLIASNCDVIGYDRYAPFFADSWFAGLLASTDKPALCGEFSYPPYHDGMQGFAKYTAAWADDEAAAGRAYRQWIQDAARNPYCVGGSWFQYRDEPITGRGPGHGVETVYGEDYAFGLVDVTDRPKWPLVRAVHDANLEAVLLRLKD